MSEPVIRYSDADCRFATWDRVLIQIWRGDTTATNVVRLGVVARAYLTEVGMPISSVAVVEPSSPPPSDEIRSQLSRFYRDLASQMKAQIVVAEGSGFRAALVRGVGITLSALAPRALPFRFVSSVKDATITIAPHLSPRAGGAAGLQLAIDKVRGRAGEELAAGPR